MKPTLLLVMVFICSCAAQPVTPVDVLYENIAAANAEDIDRYMNTIHPHAPGYGYTENKLAELNEIYDLHYSMSVINVTLSPVEATITCVLTTTKLSGRLEFRNNTQELVVTAERHNGHWKLSDTEVIETTYLD